MNCEYFCTEPATKVAAAYRASYDGFVTTHAAVSFACDDHIEAVVETLGDIAGETGYVATKSII